MSRRTKQQPAASRRTRRAEQPAAFAETQKVVSNPIFYCGTGASQSKPAPPRDQLRCAYGPGAVGALVHDPAGSGIGNGKPLPLPPCRAQRAGPAAQFVVGGPRVRVLRRAQHQDPFLAAYVACSKSAGAEKSGGQAKRQQEKKKTTTRRKGGKGEVVVVPGCGGIWNGWAAGARYAGAAMSCKNVCAVADNAVHARDAPAATPKEPEKEAEAGPTGPTLDLSWAPVVLSARAMERRREQRY